MMLKKALFLAALSLSAHAAVIYNVNLTLPLTTNGPGTITVAGFLTVNDVNANNIVDSGEITDLSLNFTTSLGPASHSLLFSNATVDVVGTMLRIGAGGLLIPATSDLTLDATNYVSISTINPDPNSALFSVSGGMLDLGGGLISHTRTIEVSLNGPAPNFDPIGAHLSVLQQDNQSIAGISLDTSVPEPGSLGLLLGGALALGIMRRRK